MKEFSHPSRKETRKDRYAAKSATAQTYSYVPVCVNFHCDGNVAFVIRSAACFGAKEVIVIGSLPEPNELRRLSGGMCELIKIRTFSNTHEFLEAARNENAAIVSAELNDEAVNICDFSFDLTRTTYLVSGHEQIGVPAEILQHSQAVFLPMPGAGFCLNTSQCATVMMYEYVRQANL